MNNWKSLYIYYISGTGNAQASSEWIADKAEKRGLKTVVQQIDRLENIVMPLEEERPLIGFAFPTHGFNAAPIILKFISGFPPQLCNGIETCTISNPVYFTYLIYHSGGDIFLKK
jgi:flavodoxin